MDFDLTRVDQLLANRGDDPYDVMEVLQDIQDEYRFLPEPAIIRVAETLDVPLIEVFRLANFYKAFSLKPRGKHLITVCQGTACHVQGAPRLIDEVRTLLHIQPGHTTKDKLFTLEAVNCVGACALAPVVIIDGTVYDHVTPAKLKNLIEEYRSKAPAEEVAHA